VNRNSLLWMLVLFFGASLVFRGLRSLTEGEPTAVVAGVQVGALAAIVIVLVLFVRRRGS
jgi:hypothetical protein